MSGTDVANAATRPKGPACRAGRRGMHFKSKTRQHDPRTAPMLCVSSLCVRLLGPLFGTDMRYAATRPLCNSIGFAVSGTAVGCTAIRLLRGVRYTLLRNASWLRSVQY
eukprot:1814807-Rhodomonas_salina.2